MLRILFIIFLTIATLLTAAGWYVKSQQIDFFLRRWSPVGSLVIGCGVVEGRLWSDIWMGGPSSSHHPNGGMDFDLPGLYVYASRYQSDAIAKHSWHVECSISAWSLSGVTVLCWLGFYYRPLRRLRRKRGLCVKCGYDLTGNESGVCSECGTEVKA